MKIRHPDTGQMVTLYRTEEYKREIQAFYERVCNHNFSKELRIYSASNGAEHYRHQCLTCGEAVGQNVSKTSVQSEGLSLFDQVLAEQYKASRAKERDAIHRKHIKLQSAEDVRLSKKYKEYLASKEWAAKRSRVMERAANLCEGCREVNATEVHHMNYEHLFDEFLFELVALCHSCHARWHQENEAEEYEELPCCGCRFQGEGNSGQPWCFVYDVPARDALSPKGQCGPELRSFEPLK